jgi:hypothetical protein
MAPRQTGKWSKQEYCPERLEPQFSDWHEKGPGGVCVPLLPVQSGFCGGQHGGTGMRYHQRNSKDCAKKEAAWRAYFAARGREGKRERGSVITEPAKKRVKRTPATAAKSEEGENVEFVDAPRVIKPRGLPKKPSTRASAKRGGKPGACDPEGFDRGLVGPALFGIANRGRSTLTANASCNLKSLPPSSHHIISPWSEACEARGGTRGAARAPRIDAQLARCRFERGGGSRAEEQSVADGGGLEAEQKDQRGRRRSGPLARKAFEEGRLGKMARGTRPSTPDAVT